MSDNMQSADEVLDDEVLDEAEGADSFYEAEEFDPFDYHKHDGNVHCRINKA